MLGRMTNDPTKNPACGHILGNGALKARFMNTAANARLAPFPLILLVLPNSGGVG